jgi:transcriptional regulator with XRE-family HTH domain
MRLTDYLRLHGLNSAEFAKIAGIRSRQTVWNYRHGLRFPTPNNIRLIDTATRGAVTAEDFLRHYEELNPVDAPAAA